MTKLPGKTQTFCLPPPLSFPEFYKILLDSPEQVKTNDTLQETLIYYVYNHFLDPEDVNLSLIPSLKKKASIPRDLNKSLQYYTLAAKQGNSRVYLKLGALYEKSNLFKDLGAACWWYLKALDANKPLAQEGLARFVKFSKKDVPSQPVYDFISSPYVLTGESFKNLIKILEDLGRLPGTVSVPAMTSSASYSLSQEAFLPQEEERVRDLLDQLTLLQKNIDVLNRPGVLISCVQLCNLQDPGWLPCMQPFQGRAYLILNPEDRPPLKKLLNTLEALHQRNNLKSWLSSAQTAQQELDVACQKKAAKVQAFITLGDQDLEAYKKVRQKLDFSKEAYSILQKKGEHLNKANTALEEIVQRVCTLIHSNAGNRHRLLYETFPKAFKDE